MNEVAEYAVQQLKQYSKENHCLVRSTIDLSPLEGWLLLQMHKLYKANVRGWVDINEQKPEPEQCCLITNSVGRVTVAQYVAADVFRIGKVKYRVTAWMVLPPPFA